MRCVLAVGWQVLESPAWAYVVGPHAAVAAAAGLVLLVLLLLVHIDTLKRWHRTHTMFMTILLCTDEVDVLA